MPGPTTIDQALRDDRADRSKIKALRADPVACWNNSRSRQGQPRHSRSELTSPGFPSASPPMSGCPRTDDASVWAHCAESCAGGNLRHDEEPDSNTRSPSMSTTCGGSVDARQRARCAIATPCGGVRQFLSRDREAEAALWPVAAKLREASRAAARGRPGGPQSAMR